VRRSKDLRTGRVLRLIPFTLSFTIWSASSFWQAFEVPGQPDNSGKNQERLSVWSQREKQSPFFKCPQFVSGVERLTPVVDT
jgi:hypothetical protein